MSDKTKVLIGLALMLPGTLWLAGWGAVLYVRAWLEAPLPTGAGTAAAMFVVGLSILKLVLDDVEPP